MNIDEVKFELNASDIGKLAEEKTLEIYKEKLRKESLEFKREHIKLCYKALVEYISKHIQDCANNGKREYWFSYGICDTPGLCCTIDTEDGTFMAMYDFKKLVEDGYFEKLESLLKEKNFDINGKIRKYEATEWRPGGYQYTVTIKW